MMRSIFYIPIPLTVAMLCMHSSHVYDITVLVLGLDNAGKTTFLANLLHEPASCVVPTIGYRNVRYKYKRAQITLVDLGGGPSIRSIWPNYYADAHAAVFILDASDTERLEESRRVFFEMSQHPLMLDKPVMVFGNKQDKIESGAACDIEQMLGLKDTYSSSASHQSDTTSVDNLSAELALAHNSQGGSADDVISTPTSNTHVARSTLHVSIPDIRGYISSRKGIVRFRYCSAIDQRREMRRKVILKSLSWLLRCVRVDWNALEARVCNDSADQKERELRERRERSEQVRLIREKREREEGGEQGNRPESARAQNNPFLPISRAVEKAETREQTVTAVQVMSYSSEEREDTPPPDSEEAVAIIAQYFQDISEKTSNDNNCTILGMKKSAYVEHVSSEPTMYSNHNNSEEFLRTRYPLHTIHEGASNQPHSKRRGHNRITPTGSNFQSLGPLRSSPGSPPSSILQTFQKSAYKQVSEVYPLIPSNPWCRPFSPVSENSEEEKEKFNEHEMQSRSLPDITDCTD